MVFMPRFMRLLGAETGSRVELRRPSSRYWFCQVYGKPMLLYLEGFLDGFVQVAQCL
jgi:hypothetical protein